MNFSIIADDLTGANDTGVKLSQCGLKSTVLFELNFQSVLREENVVYNTDSRYLSKEKAYEKVCEVSKVLRQLRFDHVYKKMDSTLRGNVGIELDAVYKVYQPDFIIISPAAPDNDRTLENGILKYEGVQIDRSDFKAGAFEVIRESNISNIIKSQSDYETAIINHFELKRGFKNVKNVMDYYYKHRIPYLIFDALTEKDLERIANYVTKSGYNVVWAGSSGLIKYLPKQLKINETYPLHFVPENEKQTLFIVGSLNSLTRTQLKKILKRSNVKGFKVYPHKLLQTDTQKREEISRVAEEINHLGSNHHIVIYTSDDATDIEKTKRICESKKLNQYQSGKMISDSLGMLVHTIVKEGRDYNGIVLSGGDTAVDVCSHLGATGIVLLDEISPAIPVGKINGPWDRYIVTKGGGIGTINTFSEIIDYLSGREDNHINTIC